MVGTRENKIEEIKFRARNANLPQCWIYGYFVIEKGSYFIVNDDSKFQIIAGTECQYIGLRDRQGKEIYEGDIVKWSFQTPQYVGGTCIGEIKTEIIGEIVFNRGCFSIYKKQPEGILDINLPIFNGEKFEVIGNIYENSNLLKNDKRE